MRQNQERQVSQAEARRDSGGTGTHRQPAPRPRSLLVEEALAPTHLAPTGLSPHPSGMEPAPHRSGQSELPKRLPSPVERRW